MRDLGVPYWDLGPRVDLKGFLRSLLEFVPEARCLGFWGGRPSPELREFCRRHRCGFDPDRVESLPAELAEAVWIAVGAGILWDLSQLMNRHAETELAVHLFVLSDEAVLVAWWDIPIDVFSVSCELPEQRIAEWADALAVGYERVPSDA